MEERIVHWLELQGAQFVQEYVTFSGIRADFVVVKPFPLIIECAVISSPLGQKTKFKRQLAHRILAAQDFGTSVPYLLIYSGEENFVNQPCMPFVDLAVPISGLPTLPELKELKVRPVIEKILKNALPCSLGQNKDWHIDKQSWDEALSLEELCGLKEFGLDTLARQIQRVALGTLEQLQVDSTAQQRNPERSPQNSRKSPIQRLVLSKKFSDAFNELLLMRVSKVVPGKSEQIDVHIDEHNEYVSRYLVYETVDNRKLVLRRLQISSSSAFHKPMELRADAAVLRTFADVRPSSFILLLGSVQGNRRDFSKIDFQKVVTSFQLSGWNVFPWDFNKTKPKFLEYLELWAKRQ